MLRLSYLNSNHLMRKYHPSSIVSKFLNPEIFGDERSKYSYRVTEDKSLNHMCVPIPYTLCHIEAILPTVTRKIHRIPRYYQ